MITAPLVGTFRSPVTFGLKSNIKSGIKKDFNNRYAISPNLLAKGIYDTIWAWIQFQMVKDSPLLAEKSVS